MKREFDEHIRAQLLLCNRLEQIADALPNNLDHQECLSVARNVYATIKSAHRFEEEKLFPYMLKSPSNAQTCKSVERLCAEHWEDEIYAFDVQDALINYVKDPKDANAESLGYMLRGFFEGVRRHIAFEREHILPALNSNYGDKGSLQ